MIHDFRGTVSSPLFPGGVAPSTKEALFCAATDCDQKKSSALFSDNKNDKNKKKRK